MGPDNASSPHTITIRRPTNNQQSESPTEWSPCCADQEPDTDKITRNLDSEPGSIINRAIAARVPTCDYWSNSEHKASNHTVLVLDYLLAFSLVQVRNVIHK